jgi:hypothetical protein
VDRESGKLRAGEREFNMGSELQMACGGIVRMAAYFTLREELILKT